MKNITILKTINKLLGEYTVIENDDLYNALNDAFEEIERIIEEENDDE